MALSWVSSANGHSDFPIENLPFGVCRRGPEGHICVAIGDELLDLFSCHDAGLINNFACTRETLNDLMSLGRENTARLRARLTDLLREDAPEREQAAKHLLARSSVEMLTPCSIGDYTDFYASIHHATNVGSMFRPDNPLLPNYKYLPVGYHGRASTVVISGTPVRRPSGQTRDESSRPPQFGASKRLDYEIEVGVIIGRGNDLGEPIPIHDAEQHVFGLCLVNDWSARDIQTWEYQPLGPFLSKNFATSMSPWIVTLDALEPYRVPTTKRPEGDPAPLPYLDFDEDRAIDITVEVSIASQRMRGENIEPLRLSRGSFREMYWTIAQLIAHHTSNGCRMCAGDLLASGTITGRDKQSRGCLLELTWRGTDPIDLPSGEQRRFLEDGDEVIMRAWCERAGLPRIGFGECRGIVLPARGE
ncbi:MAG TPA: fumarylacetoacetase [Thermoanaerobaculia bacterium]|nr:fumarylacetoacetase [Thermoanaerobaculia bacterium]